MITLKSIKVMDSLSQETFCYSANLYWKNKKIGSVSNGGYGGCDSQYMDKGDHIEKLWIEMDDYIDSLPKVNGEYGDYEQTLETICWDIVTKHLEKKDMKKDWNRMQKTWSFFTGEWDGSWRTLKLNGDWNDSNVRDLVMCHLKVKYPKGFTMLTGMSFDDYCKLNANSAGGK